MPPKVTFTKESIIEAAFELATEKGLKSISARLVAQKLKSSTAPVYSYFKSMDELKEVVRNKAIRQLLEYQTQSYTDQIFLNIGIGFVLFARDYQELFRAIFMEKNDFRGINSDFLDAIREEMAKDANLSELTQEERDRLLYKMWIFIHGLATLICVDAFSNTTTAFITNTLIDVSSAIIFDAIKKSQKFATH